jgi:ribose 5-phosphate isomerase B
MKIALAGDHAGFVLKKHIIEYLIKKGYEVEDFGTNSKESCDYPDFAHPLAVAVEGDSSLKGIVLCGSGNGVNMVVNKYNGIRCAVCWDIEIAKLAREHNDANICALPARFLSSEKAEKIVDAFLSAKFEGGRHQRRIEKIPIRK